MAEENRACEFTEGNYKSSFYMLRNYIAYKSELLMIFYIIGIRECSAFYVSLSILYQNEISNGVYKGIHIFKNR